MDFKVFLAIAIFLSSYNVVTHSKPIDIQEEQSVLSSLLSSRPYQKDSIHQLIANQVVWHQSDLEKLFDILYARQYRKPNIDELIQVIEAIGTYQQDISLQGMEKAYNLLIDAIKANNLYHIRTLLAKGVAFKDSTFADVIYDQQVSIETIEWLFNHGAKLDPKRDYIYSAIPYKAPIETIEWLFNHGAKLGPESDYIAHAIFYKAPTETIEWLFNHDAKLDPESDYIAYAITYKAPTETIEWLFNHGAKLNPENDYIAYAIFYKAPTETIEWLFNHGVKLNPESDYIAHAITYKAPTETIEWLFNHGAKLDPKRDYIAYVICYGASVIKTIEWFLKHGAKLVPGRDYIDSAISHGRSIETIEWLLEHGAWLNPETRYIAHAISREQLPEVILLLINNGAQIHAKDLFDYHYHFTWDSFINYSKYQDIYQKILKSLLPCDENTYAEFDQLRNTINQSRNRDIDAVIQNINLYRLYQLIFPTLTYQKVFDPKSIDNRTFFSLKEIQKFIKENNIYIHPLLKTLNKVVERHKNSGKIKEMVNDTPKKVEISIKINEENTDNIAQVQIDPVDPLPWDGSPSLIDSFNGYYQRQRNNVFLVKTLRYLYIHLTKTSPNEPQNVFDLLQEIKGANIMTQEQYQICYHFYQALEQAKKNNDDHLIETFFKQYQQTGTTADTMLATIPHGT